MRDEIARLSEAVARDPAGLAWLPLADALRRGRQLALATRVAERGLARHPYSADGHDLLARIAADGGDLGRARDEWEMALRVEPGHVGALLGRSWLALAAGDAAGARRWWQDAHRTAPDDARVAAAGRTLQRRVEMTNPPASPTTAPTTAAPSTASVRAPHPPGLLPSGAVLALVVDADGLIIAGDGSARAGGAAHGSCASPDVSTDVLAAELTGLTRDAQVALAGLRLGAWERLHVECEALHLAMAPMDDDAVALVATEAAAPAGLPRLLLERTRRRALAWVDAL